MPVINVLCRPRWVVVCTLFMLCIGQGAQAQQFLGPDLIGGKDFDAAAKQGMLRLVDPAMKAITAEEPDPQAISASRKTLLTPLKDPSATTEFKQAFSEIIAGRMDAAVNHKSVLVRINAMILLASMTDADSEMLIETGLVDKSVAVQRKAVEALRQRVRGWLKQGSGTVLGKVDDAMKKTIEMLDQRPAPQSIVVTPALGILLDINSEQSLVALIDQLDKRVQLHREDDSLVYQAEQMAFDQLSRTMPILRPFPFVQASALNRTAFRTALLILEQIKAGKIKTEDQIKASKTMLAQCFRTLGAITAGAGKQSPSGQFQVNSWIQNSNWDAIEKLLKDDWAAILRAEPFGLSVKDLEVLESKPAE